MNENIITLILIIVVTVISVILNSDIGWFLLAILIPGFVLALFFKEDEFFTNRLSFLSEGWRFLVLQFFGGILIVILILLEVNYLFKGGDGTIDTSLFKKIPIIVLLIANTYLVYFFYTQYRQDALKSVKRKFRRTINKLFNLVFGIILILFSVQQGWSSFIKINFAIELIKTWSFWSSILTLLFWLFGILFGYIFIVYNPNKG